MKIALESGKVAQAGLDVLCNEPNVDPWFFDREDVVLQPHVGGLADTAFQRVERDCIKNIKAYFTTGVPNSPVRPLGVR